MKFLRRFSIFSTSYITTLEKVKQIVHLKQSTFSNVTNWISFQQQNLYLDRSTKTRLKQDRLKTSNSNYFKIKEIDLERRLLPPKLSRLEWIKATSEWAKPSATH